MEPKPHLLSYPEGRVMYRALEAEEVGIHMPEYVAKAVEDQAEALGAEVHIDVWWPYTYIYIVKDLEKEVEGCFNAEWKEAEKDAEIDCRERCGNDGKCFEECIDTWKYDVWRDCAERVGDEVRPSIAKAVQELEQVFKLYGIEAEVRSEWHHGMVKVRAKLKGYHDIIPIEVAKMLLAYVVDAAKTKYISDLERIAYRVSTFLFNVISVERVIKLIQSITKENIRITKTLDEYADLRRYEMTIEHEDVKITLYVTEEKDGEIWIIRDVTVGAIEFAEVADLTPA